MAVLAAEEPEAALFAWAEDEPVPDFEEVPVFAEPDAVPDILAAASCVCAGAAAVWLAAGVCAVAEDDVFAGPAVAEAEEATA